ncbi:MAG: TonB-dependent receptor domain-containing protein [Pyrinomonadaceae bacterium]
MKLADRLFSFCIKKCLFLAICLFLGSAAAFAQSQAAASDLRGTVVDQNGAVIPGATITARNIGTGITRTTTSGGDGVYTLIALPPGEYEITTEAATFKKASIAPVRLTVGQSAELKITMEVGAADAVVTITGESVELIETSKTSVGSTIDQNRIQNLPINERSATGFALTLSTVGRDNGRPIGPAPTSGLNIGGQRGRSTQVNVDGADFTDNSINAARSTVSQDAVQEYQVSTNSYTPEFGRATGGVINVVTKRGTNDFHGSFFGYIRDKRIQANNAFSPIDNPDYRRTQYGFTLGGPIAKERTFFFVGFERRQRDESGFFTSNVAQGLTGSLTFTVPGLPSQTFANITPAQAAFAQALLGNMQTATFGINYLYLASSGGYTALTGTNPLISPGGAIPAGTPVGQRFFLSGTPIPISDIAYRPLNSLQQIFPVTERTNFSTIRLDHNIDENNQLTMRLGYNTGNLTGIQVESQNQSLGQNDFSRTGITTFKDTSVSTGLNSTIGGNAANELRFTFGKRQTVFRSQNGDAVAYNISGTAFIGRELFSPVDRTEERFQIADNFSVVRGNHTFKFGADFNWITIPQARFELNFAGLFNFGELGATSLICSGLTGAQQQGCLAALTNAPNFTPVQTYGLGFPSIFIQGFGDPISKISNKPIAFFAQDSWKIGRNFTLNYGVRYDYEFTQQIPPVPFADPLSGINLSANDILAAQDALGVQQGIPRDKNNFAPRLGFAWDIGGNQKTKLSGSLGIYYDHPLLALGFNSDIADAAQQQQSVLTPGSPSPTALFNATQVFHGTVCGVVGSVPTICGAAVTPGVASSAQYQFGRQRFNDQTFTGFGAVLPFTLPIAKDFEYASATQGNLTFERQLSKDTVISASYLYVSAHHLPRPTDLNTPNVASQIENYRRCFGVLPTNTTQAATVNPAACSDIVAQPIPGIISVTTRGGVIAPAIANFFRPNAPNYFLAQALSGGTITKPVLDGALAATGTLRTPGVISPFGSVNAQLSDGNSTYNALKVDLNRRFSNNFLFLASYTWSHSIDDSSDLQTLLVAQDVNRFDLEKANSLFDQRHRFVFSGAFSSPDRWRSGSGIQKLFSNFTIAPIIEISSGRPFNIITNVDTNNDQSTQTDRPSINADGSLCVPGTPGCITPLITNGSFSTGNLGRNTGLTHSFMSFDLGITRKIRFGERASLDLIAQGFNLFNRFNEGSATPLFSDVNSFGQRAANGAFFSRPTAAFDPRQFQFGAKLSF